MWFFTCGSDDYYFDNRNFGSFECACCKKIVKKDSNPNKGIWMATRNSNGEAVYWKKGMGNKDNPDKWTKCNTTCEINGQAVNDCCVFDSPLNVRNFSLTAVGGGGR